MCGKGSAKREAHFSAGECQSRWGDDFRICRFCNAHKVNKGDKSWDFRWPPLIFNVKKIKLQS